MTVEANKAVCQIENSHAAGAFDKRKRRIASDIDAQFSLNAGIDVHVEDGFDGLCRCFGKMKDRTYAFQKDALHDHHDGQRISRQSDESSMRKASCHEWRILLCVASDKDASGVAYRLTRVVAFPFSRASHGDDHVTDGVEVYQRTREFSDVIGHHNRSDAFDADARHESGNVRGVAATPKTARKVLGLFCDFASGGHNGDAWRSPTGHALNAGFE